MYANQTGSHKARRYNERNTADVLQLDVPMPIEYLTLVTATAGIFRRERGQYSGGVNSSEIPSQIKRTQGHTDKVIQVFLATSVIMVTHRFSRLAVFEGMQLHTQFHIRYYTF